MKPQTFIGLDIGGTHIRRLVLRDGDLTPIDRVETAHSYDELVGQLAEMIYEVKSLEGATAVGIGLPGRTDPERPIWVPMLPFLNQSPFVTDLETKTGTQITLINDAQAALVGEVKRGRARGTRNSILVTLGTGIGGAMMIDGKIYVGHNGSAGSFGWLLAPVRLHVNPERGPWERWSSGTALVAIARGLGMSVPELMATGPDAPLEVRDAIFDFATRIGRGIGSLAGLLDPQVVIVSGGLVDSWERLHEGVREGFLEAASPSVRKTQIHVGELGSSAGAIGAAFTAQSYFTELLTNQT